MKYDPISVESYSGYKVNERPVAFTYQEKRWEVEEVLDRWHEGGLDAERPEVDYFKARTNEGTVFLLRYLPDLDVWEIQVSGATCTSELP